MIEQHTIILIGIFIGALLSAYLLNRLLEWFTSHLARRITEKSDAATTSQNHLKIRRYETFLSLGNAVGRTAVVIVLLILAWRFANPSSTPIALIGVSTVFAVIAGATLVPLLRDITYGFIMIAEEWYNVGDHIVIEPFNNAGGVVEQVTLRSTKIRSVNGEVIWFHNQHIQGVRVTHAASHTLAIETFVNDPVRGEKIIQEAFRLIPTGPTTIPQAPVITEIKPVDNLWRITSICEVTPFREWIIDDFTVQTIKERDDLDGEDKTIVHGPIVFYANSTAEKRYRRAVRARTVQATPARQAKQKPEAT